MEKRQENRLSMYRLVENTCMNYESVWAGIKPFSSAMDSFKKIIKEIKAERQLQEENYTGITNKKNQTITKLVAVTMKFVSVLKDYSVVHNDTIMYKKIAYTKTALSKSRDTILEDKCMFVYNKSEMLAKELSEYGISEHDYKEFKGLIRKYSDLILSSKEAINYRKITTKKIASYFIAGDALLRKRLDNLILLVKESAPDFYDAYKNARKTIKTGTKSKANRTMAFERTAA